MLFPEEAVEKAIEKSSCVLHDEVIWKVVSTEKPAQKATKCLHFLQSTKRPSQQTSGKFLGHCSASSAPSGSKASPSSRHGRGKKF